MNQSFDASTIIFAVLAIFIIWKLRSVLGTRTGDERPPMNPFARRGAADPKSQAPTPTGQVITLPVGAAAGRPQAPDADRWKGIAEQGSSLAHSLDAIAASDPSFNGKSFAEGARAAYEMIVSAFAKGDRATLAGLLSKEVLDGFNAAITEREAQGQTVESTFVSLDQSKIEEAALNGKMAQITIRFESQQINTTRMRDGEIAEGSSAAAGSVIDHWTFARDVTSRDPNWKLVATNAE